eukprot:s105_g3.t1
MSESSTSGRCAWLVVEGLRAEEKAADFDRQGQSAQAALHHSRAASKFKEAAEICPDADREELEGHAQDITARAVYLESLGGMPPSMPLEDHIGELSISLDLSVAQQPQDEQVPELLARSGVTGASAELCDSGLQLVQALKSQEELQSFIRRILASSWRKVKDDEASAQEFAKFAQDFSAGDDSFQKLRERLRPEPVPLFVWRVWLADPWLMCPSSPRGAAWASALGSLEDVRRASTRPHIAVLGSLQCRCERAGRWTAVLRILDLMQGVFGLRADITALGSCLSACRWTMALQLLGTAGHWNIQLSGIAVNAAVSACSRGHQWLVATSLGSLQSRGVADGDGLTRINSVAKACEHGLHWDRVLSLMTGMGCKMCQPDVFSCSTGVSACSRTEHWEESMDLWRELQLRLVKPNEVAYGAACAASRVGSSEAALKLLAELEQRRLVKNLIMYNIQLSSYADGSNWQEALSLLDQMLKVGPAPNLISLREVAAAAATACCLQSRGLFNRLQRLVDEVFPSLRSPPERSDRKSFSSLVLVNSAIEALELLESHDSLGEGSVMALQGQMWPVLTKLRRLQGTLPAMSFGTGEADLESLRLESFFNLGTSKLLQSSLATLRLARLGQPWLCRARSCAREGHGESTVPWEPKAQVVLAWRAAQLVVEVTDGTGTALQCGSSVLRYGSCHDRWLMPILVEHDRSRHAERRILVALIAEVAKYS